MTEEKPKINLKKIEKKVEDKGENKCDVDLAAGVDLEHLDACHSC